MRLKSYNILFSLPVRQTLKILSVTCHPINVFHFLIKTLRHTKSSEQSALYLLLFKNSFQKENNKKYKNFHPQHIYGQ